MRTITLSVGKYNERSLEQVEKDCREWREHQKRSNQLWQAFLETSPNTPERSQAKEDYLTESKAFWGEESLGITQLQGRIDSHKQ